MSPGLIAALETAELIPAATAFEQKVPRAKYILTLLYHPEMTVQQLLKKAVPLAKLDGTLLSFKAVADNALLKAWEFTLAWLGSTNRIFRMKLTYGPSAGFPAEPANHRRNSGGRQTKIGLAYVQPAYQRLDHFAPRAVGEMA